MNKMGRFGWSFKDILIYLLIFIIGSLIVTFLISPNSFNNFKSNVKSILPSSNSQEAISNINNAGNTEDLLITKCKISFNKCKDITEQKYPSVSYTLLKIEKFDDEKKAREFYDIWKTVGISNIFDYALYGFTIEEQKFQNVSPIVLIALRMKGAESEFATVVVCDKFGELNSIASQSLLCG